ncbi:unnamed protein product, partial [Amoebophrya sp. A25]|eukprot:GSA25T00012549001.1
MQAIKKLIDQAKNLGASNVFERNPPIPDTLLRDGDGPDSVTLDTLQTRGSETARRSAAAYRHTRRALGHADALSVDTSQLLERLAYLRQYPEDFCQVRRVHLKSESEDVYPVVDEAEPLDLELDELAQSARNGRVDEDVLLSRIEGKKRAADQQNLETIEARNKDVEARRLARIKRTERWQAEKLARQSAEIDEQVPKAQERLFLDAAERRKRRPQIVGEQRQALLESMGAEVAAEAEQVEKIEVERGTLGVSFNDSAANQSHPVPPEASSSSNDDSSVPEETRNQDIKVDDAPGGRAIVNAGDEKQELGPSALLEIGREGKEQNAEDRLAEKMLAVPESSKQTMRQHIQTAQFLELPTYSSGLLSPGEHVRASLLPRGG